MDYPLRVDRSARALVRWRPTATLADAADRDRRAPLEKPMKQVDDEGEPFRVTLMRVMAMQVGALIVLAILQLIYNK
jgi:hypothetical protein